MSLLLSFSLSSLRSFCSVDRASDLFVLSSAVEGWAEGVELEMEVEAVGFVCGGGTALALALAGEDASESLELESLESPPAPKSLSSSESSIVSDGMFGWMVYSSRYCCCQQALWLLAMNAVGQLKRDLRVEEIVKFRRVVGSDLRARARVRLTI